MPEQFLHGVETVEIDDGIRAIRTLRSSVIGLIGTAPEADLNAFPADTPVIMRGPRHAAALGETGTLAEAFDAAYQQGAGVMIAVRVAEGPDEPGSLAAVAGDPSLKTGVNAFLDAEALTGLKPRIIAAPGWTHQRPDDAANPVVAALGAVTGRLRAVSVVDGPGEGFAEATAYRDDWGSDRIYMVDPGVKMFGADGEIAIRPASGYAAGIISATDLRDGFWFSPSNRLINGIVGVQRPVDFGISDTGSEANLLNEAGIATIIRHEGFRGSTSPRSPRSSPASTARSGM